MNSHLHDNVRPLICPPVTRTRRHGGVAQVIHLPVRYRRRPPRVGYVVAFSLAALAVSIALITLIAVAVRSGRGAAGDLIVGWPWW